MKSMNRKEGKKIAVMAAVVMGIMVIAFLPFAAATVTSFSVTPSSGVVGVVDSYNALVTTDGVATINITIPAGFVAVQPVMGGVQIARVDFWNESTRDYYGFATITSNNADPTTKVDIDCDFGGLTVSTTQTVNYDPGAVNRFESGFGTDTSSAVITLPTEAADGSIEINITCTPFQLDDVMIAIGQFVRNPTTANDYVFTTDDGKTATVSITAQKGRAAVFRDGWWFADRNGDHKTDIYELYGDSRHTPAVGDIDNNGINDIVAFRIGWWCISKEDHSGTDWAKSFLWGNPGDKPVIGDIDNNGVVDAVIFRGGWWFVSKEDHTGTDWAKSFLWGQPGDIPVIADIDNNGVVDAVIFRGGWWFVLKEDHTGTDWAKSFLWGQANDKPIVDDIRMEGSNDVAILRNGAWWVSKRDHTGTDYGFAYGLPGDDPILNEFI